MHGILIGFCSFMLIGLFHPIVIKAEYYFSKRIYPLFIIVGIVCLVISFLIKNNFVSSLLGVTGFSSFWSVKELFEQEKRVQKGWFPKNPDRI
ncbi:DUF4491 family protein [Ruminiclostridium sufflavum]|uniref:DUF4491 family protein n=1 Tax=Ruminiclostridium sufflavum TaxID=396504 RepID=UPI000D7BE6A2|nr:DUF4491 family protein [Ruminiclostridium sufflavum]